MLPRCWTFRGQRSGLEMAQAIQVPQNTQASQVTNHGRWAEKYREDFEARGA